MSKAKKKSAKPIEPTIPGQQSLLNAIAADLAGVAEQLAVEPGMLTMPNYYKNGGKFTEWQMRKFGGYNAIKKLFYEKDLPKSRATVGEMKELRKKYLQNERDMDNRELFIERMKEILDKVKPIKTVPYKPKDSYKPVKRVVNLLLSDLHFGSDLEARETGHAWGKVEEARSFARIVKNICDYKTHYRSESKLVVSIIGDVIENVLHGQSSAAPLHEQCCRAIHLLSQAVARFSESYPEVDIYFAVGNHGRDTAVHMHGRATAQKWNAMETTIYYAVKKTCASLKNVKFHQPFTPWAVYDALGHKVYVTHGDTNMSIGNPGKTVSIGQIETQVNRLNSALKDDEKYAVVAMGHVHVALVTQLPNGTFLFLNGPLVPPNSFAQTFGLGKCPQNQVMWETTEKFAVGDQRFINAQGAEKDASLDKIIQPFVGIDV
jgi:hypothetical protein